MSGDSLHVLDAALLGRKFEERHSPLALCARLHLHPRLLILTHGGHWSHRLVEESRQDDHDEDHGRLDEQPRLAQRDSPATQHAVVLDAFEAEPENEGERQRRKVEAMKIKSQLRFWRTTTAILDSARLGVRRSDEVR